MNAREMKAVIRSNLETQKFKRGELIKTIRSYDINNQDKLWEYTRLLWRKEAMERMIKNLEDMYESIKQGKQNISKTKKKRI